VGLNTIRMENTTLPYALPILVLFIKIFQLHDLAIVAIDAVQKSYDEASLGLTHGDYNLY
jgi:hypothetical protein